MGTRDKKEGRKKVILEPLKNKSFPESRHPMKEGEPYERIVLTKFRKGGMVGRDYAKKC